MLEDAASPRAVARPPHASLDWEIYRALYRSTDNPVWDAVAQPTLGAELGKLGISRNTLWRRLKDWRRLGFIQGHEVIPNPSVFGVGLVTNEVRLSNPRARRRFLDDLDLVDGIFLVNFDLGPRTMVVSVADLPKSQSRRKELIRRLPGVEAIGPDVRVWLPACPTRLSLREWKVVAALRDAPEAALAELARAAGTSSKTFSRRYRALRESHAILTYRIEDFTKFPGTVSTFVVRLADDADSRAVAAEVGRRLPGLLETVFIGCPPFAPNRRLAYSAYVGSASAMEEIEAIACDIPGVVELETRFWGGERAYRAWFDQKITDALHAASH